MVANFKQSILEREVGPKLICNNIKSNCKNKSVIIFNANSNTDEQYSLTDIKNKQISNSQIIFVHVGQGLC